MSDFHKNDFDAIDRIGSKTGAAMWQEIDDLVTRWAQSNPQQANVNRLYNQEQRDNAADKKFTEWKDDAGRGLGTRAAISVHPNLINYIETFYPKFFESNENVRKFGNTYKMFKIPDKL